MVYKFFDKKARGSGTNMEAKPNERLPEELHKPVIRKLEKKNGLLWI